MDNLIEVRVRDADEAEGKRLCGVPFDLLDEVIQRLKRWGLMDMEGRDLTGQFVLDDSGCYFEVIVEPLEVD